MNPFAGGFGLATGGGGLSGSSSATSGPATSGGFDAGFTLGGINTGTQGLSTTAILIGAAVVVGILVIFRRK